MKKVSCASCAKLIPYDSKRKPRGFALAQYFRAGEVVVYACRNPREDVCVPCFDRGAVAVASKALASILRGSP